MSASDPNLRRVTLSLRRFRLSDQKPSVLTLEAGEIAHAAGHDEVQALERLDITLWNELDARMPFPRAARLAEMNMGNQIQQA